MHRCFRSRARRALPALSVVVVLAVFSAGSSLAAGTQSSTGVKLAGAWSGSYSGAYSGTFTLHWRQTGSKLRGSIKLSRPSGTYGITGSVHRTAISFGAVGAGATYTGTWSGKSMSGHYKTAVGGGTWKAHKIS